MYNSVVFSIFTELCSDCHYVIPEHFHHPKKRLHTHYQSLPIPLFPHRPWQLLSVSVDLPPLDISYKWNHTIHGFLCVASCTWRNIFSVILCYSMCQYFTSVCGQIIFHCIWICHILFIHLSVDGRLNHSHSLNNAAMNIHIQVFVQTYVFSYLGYIPRNGIAASYDNSVFNFLRN